jgi:hypothetical protein
MWRWCKDLTDEAINSKQGLGAGYLVYNVDAVVA